MVLGVAAVVLAADIISKVIVVATLSDQHCLVGGFVPSPAPIRLLGGATGNLTDRIFRSPGPFRGWVVDWIQLPHWPVFNLADSAITCGVVLFVLLAVRGHRLDGTTHPAAQRSARERSAADHPAAEPAAPQQPAAPTQPEQPRQQHPSGGGGG